MNIQLPPLRDRPRDIPILAQHFAAKYSEANGLATLEVNPQALEVLKAHHWRGNVRELENTMHRAVLLAQDGHIGPEAIMLTGQGLHAGPQASGATAKAGNGGETPAGATRMVGRTVADVEKVLILDTLEHCLGNRTHAATILGISIRTLRNKLKLYSEEGLPVPMPGEGERSPA
jgi:DNA-binding NtrC family response regulator